MLLGFAGVATWPLLVPAQTRHTASRAAGASTRHIAQWAVGLGRPRRSRFEDLTPPTDERRRQEHRRSARNPPRRRCVADCARTARQGAMRRHGATQWRGPLRAPVQTDGTLPAPCDRRRAEATTARAHSRAALTPHRPTARLCAPSCAEPVPQAASSHPPRRRSPRCSRQGRQAAAHPSDVHGRNGADRWAECSVPPVSARKPAS